ncbi:MAG: hypothetical protein HKO09_05190 [Croceitalea sp.]|nr:hypothetical protein [Croceitalea sp.]
MTTLSAQKIVEKRILNPESKFIQLNTKNCFVVNVNSSNSPQMIVKASMEGEYQKDLVVRIEEDGQNVLVSADFLPNFIQPNDKLSAHKVISIALDLIIPANTNISIHGTTSDVAVQGIYKTVEITLSDGVCRLQHQSETTKVQTQKGNIILRTNKGRITAQSIYGKVLNTEIPKGNGSYILNSVEGDITIQKTE